MQGRFGTIQIGLGECVKKHSVLLAPKAKSERGLWFARVLLLLRMNPWNWGEVEEYVFLQQIESTTPLHDMNAFLGRIC